MKERTIGGARPTYALRLGVDERAIVEKAAERRGWPLSVYLRRAALERARRDLATPDADR